MSDNEQYVSEASPLLRQRRRNESEGHESDEGNGCGNSLPCDPRRNLHRYLILIIICFLSFGSYFCYDNPAAMQDIMLDKLDISVFQFSMFYALYSYPNVILSVIGGVLIDHIGIRRGAIIFATFIALGQILFATGALLNSYIFMCVARFVYGIGGESLAVAQNTYSIQWFRGKEMNMVFGLQLSMSRIGSTINFNVMERIYQALANAFPKMEGYQVLGLSLFIALSTCVVSLLCTIAMAYFDKRAARIINIEVEEQEKVRLKDIKEFKASFWLICIICVTYYVTVFPFISLGLVFFERKYGMDPGYAGAVNSATYILSACASPIFGFAIDKTGRNVFWVIAGILLTMACHAALAFTFIPPMVVMVTLGIAYSILASSLWPQIAYIVPNHQLGTAYGIMQAVQNLGLAVISNVAGQLVDSTGYLILLIFFLMWLCVALITAIILYIWDGAAGWDLNVSATERKRKMEAETSMKAAAAVNDDNVGVYT